MSIAEVAESYKTSPHFYKTARRHIYKQAILVFTAIRNLKVTHKLQLLP